MGWHEKSISEVVNELDTNIAGGLASENARERLNRYGANELPQSFSRQATAASAGSILLPAVILGMAALLCVFFRLYIPAAVLSGGAVVMAVIKYLSLLYVRNVLESVKTITAPMSTVIRDGVARIVETASLVPGDIVQLRAGDIIGADLRISESINLVMDESILPGGFMSALKEAKAVLEMSEGLAEHVNMCYTGTVVRSGSGRGIVAATGNAIAAPHAVRSPYEHERRSILAKTVAKQGKRSFMVGLACSVAVLLLCILMQPVSVDALTQSILLATTFAACAIPSFFSILQAALSAAAIRRLAVGGVVVKSLDTMDKLAGVNTIQAQKTGVISSDEMTATIVWAGGQVIAVRGRGYTPDGRFLDADGKTVEVSRNRSLALTLIGGTLCGDSDIVESGGEWLYRGDPTECALVTLAAKAGLRRSDISEMFPRVAEFPFEPERRRMTTIHKRGRQAVAYTKGTPDLILSRCVSVDINGTAHPLQEKTREQLQTVTKRFTDQGLRVIAIAYRELPALPTVFLADELEQEFTFCGLVGIDSRAKPEAVSAYNLCSGAKIRTVIVTGDHPDTAANLALSLGLSGEVLTGGGLEELPSEELQKKMRSAQICADISPMEKRAVVGALKAAGGIVAVTGTRASDAPALMAADIGISVGAAAPELTRDSADMVIEEGGYAELVHAIEESRRNFATLRAFSIFAIACFTTQLLTVLSFLLSTPFTIFSTRHLVWLNVFLALIPALSVSSERAERDIMRRPPMGLTTPVFGRLQILAAIAKSLFPTIFTVSAFFIAYNRGIAEGLPVSVLGGAAGSTAFVTLLLCLIALAHSCRSGRTSIIRLGAFTNRALWLVSLGIVAVLILGMYVPALQGIFDLRTIHAWDWVFALVAAIVSLCASELYKGLLRPILEKLIPEKTENGKSKGGSFTQRLFETFEGNDPTQEDTEPTRAQRRAAKKAARAARKAEKYEAQAPAAADTAEPASGEAEASPAAPDPISFTGPLPEETPASADTDAAPQLSQEISASVDAMVAGIIQSVAEELQSTQTEAESNAATGPEVPAEAQAETQPPVTEAPAEEDVPDAATEAEENAVPNIAAAAAPKESTAPEIEAAEASPEESNPAPKKRNRRSRKPKDAE